MYASIEAASLEEKEAFYEQLALTLDFNSNLGRCNLNWKNVKRKRTLHFSKLVNKFEVLKIKKQRNGSHIQHGHR